MVKSAFRLGVILFCLLAPPFLPKLPAKDFATYRAGDRAGEDLTTPVALDVIDAGATAALRSSEALKTPAIFRDHSGATNALATEFGAAFNAAHSNFLAAVQDAFHSPLLDDAAIASPDFGSLLAAFNLKNKNFPIPSGLAASWARGGDGADVSAKWLAALVQMTHRPIRPDELPAGFVIGETLRLVPAASPDEKLALDDAEQRGKLITESSLTTISRLRVLFRRGFSAEEQTVARTLGAFLKPNCVPDAALTQAARDRAVRQMVVADHYDAGQIIVRRGAAIDARAKAALDQLNEKLMPGLLNQQIAAERDRAQRVSEQAQREHEQALQSDHLAQTAQDELIKMRSQTISAQNQAQKIRERNGWLLGALGVVSAVTLVVLWQWLRQRRSASLLPVPAAGLPSQNPGELQAGLAPQLAQMVKEALVQELAGQRRELLSAQQTATAEIAELVRRLDELQTPMQERLRTYETQIQKLEKELAVRNEENRELLKLKIEMIRRQLEAERSGNRVDFN